MTEPRIVAVCGFGRCGSTMLMHMLEAGGIPMAEGAHPESGENSSLTEALSAASAGRAVKLLDLKLASDQGVPVDISGPWSILWLDRDPRWQAESFRKFIRAFGHPLSVRETRVFRESLIRDRDPSLDWLRGWGHPLLTLTYEAVLADPTAAAERIAGFLPWASLDVLAMARVVHVRSPRTAPDLAFEVAGTRPVGGA